MAPVAQIYAVPYNIVPCIILTQTLHYWNWGIKYFNNGVIPTLTFIWSFSFCFTFS